MLQRRLLLSHRLPDLGLRRGLATQQPPLSDGSCERYDIAIVGGGPAGCTMAAALGSLDAMSHMRIALIDSGKLSDIRKWEPPIDTYLPRTLQITASNQRFLKRLGIWHWCFEDRIQGYSRAVVTDALGKGKIDLDAPNAYSGDPAFMIETKNLVSGLLKAIDHNGSCIDVLERSKVVNMASASSTNANPAAVKWPTITLSDNRQLQARLVIGADGANSCIRKYANIGTYGAKYAQYGLVATLCLQEPISAAFQRFLPTGPIAMLPFPGGFANLVWSLDADLIQLLKSRISSDIVNAAFRLSPIEMDRIYDLLRTDASTELITNEIAWRLQSNANATNDSSAPPLVAAVMAKSSFPLQLRLVDSLTADRVALIGDAGHVMHPLAGQGLNMGLEDVQCLVQVLEGAATSGEDIGVVLDRYNSQRYVRNLAMQGIVDKVWHVFGARSSLVASLRSLAMNGLDHLPVIKSRMIHAFMQ
ncbi:putative ubiquinone biosynthesis monooxygenase [Coemansia brasiliensis]|uniref:Ubiquinone biosynthesis monooxygenase n=1 Tax=Coemansia brasiliensis TaxID=2650707 RepID=A0A9W8I8M7_9FUNG|nr:putative ubiquinone biosynthesis monooxygenase [Coemansia brasiliensis]